MDWEEIILPQAAAFLAGLDDDDYKLMDAAIRMLKAKGPDLGEPFVKRIKGSSHSNMKELRRQSKGKIFRILFAFDKERKAVLLVGGDKAEIGFDDFYDINIPIADELFANHLKSVADAREADAIAANAGKARKTKSKGRKR